MISLDARDEFDRNSGNSMIQILNPFEFQSECSEAWGYKNVDDQMSIKSNSFNPISHRRCRAEN